MSLDQPFRSEVSAPFTAENARLAALAAINPPVEGGGHLKVLPGLWLSTEPGSGAVMALRPDQNGAGFRMTLRDGDQSRWAALGWLLPPERLATGRRLGVLMRAFSETPLCYRLALRHVYSDGRIEDIFAADYAIVSPGTMREGLSHLDLDPVRLAASERTELNLFFPDRAFDILVGHLETLLIL